MWTPSFLRRNRTVTDPETGLAYVEHESPNPAEAYRAGRVDQRRAEEAAREERRRRERTARDERRRRHRGGVGLLGFLILALALAGGGYLTLSAREGSFAAGGAAVDRQVAAATTPARQAADQALDRTGASLEQAGQAVEAQGKKLRDRVD